MVDIPPSILVAKSFVLLTPDTLTARTSSSDLGIIPDIARSAEDSLLIMVARLTISSTQSRTDALDRRLLVPTCITIASGFGQIDSKKNKQSEKGVRDRTLGNLC